MSTLISRAAIAAAFALLMTVPTTAFAAGVVTSEQEARTAEIDAFVDAWSQGILSEDLATVEALPYGDAYQHWDDADRSAAIERLFLRLEESRPAGTEPIHDEAEAAFVKGFLHGYVFDRETLKASGEDLQKEIEAAREQQIFEDEQIALTRNEQILATAAPHADMLTAQAALWADLRADDLLTAGDLLTAVPQTPEELDPVFAVVDPLLASAAGMSATGTYTMRVVAGGQVTVIAGVPLCTPLPLDADRDGTTGPGGIDVLATLCISGTPEAAADLSDEGILRAIASGAGPSLTVERVGAGDQDTPDFTPAVNMVIEAYVPLENGKQMARIGFNTLEHEMPASMRVTLVPAVDAWTGAPGAVTGVVDADELAADARATADMAADAAGVELPWGEVDGLPARVEYETAPAREFAQQLLADAAENAESVRGTFEALAAQLAGDAEAATQPVVEQATTAANDGVEDAHAAAAPMVAIADETVDFYGTQLDGVVATVDGAVRPVANDAFADVGAAAEPAVLLVDETVGFYLERASATLAEAEQALVDAKASTYATLVGVNTEAGLVKNEYVYGDGATGMLPQLQSAVAPVLPGTPFDDEPAEVAGALADAAASTSAPRLAPRFGLQVESSGATAPLVVVGGFATREDTALPFVDESNVVLQFTPAPTLLKLLIEPQPGDGAYLRIDAPTPTTIEALLATRAGDDVTLAGFVMGPLPTLTEVRFTRASVEYASTGRMGILGMFAYDLASYADLVALLEDGILTGGYSHAIAAELPETFSLSFDEDAGTLVFTSEGGRLGGLDIAQGAFVQNALAGYWMHGRLSDLPTSFTFAAGGSAAAFEASEPIGAAEFERTNGPSLASVPPAFVVAYRQGAADLVHVRILGLQRLGLLDERVTVDLAGGYPLEFNIVDGDTHLFGQFGQMPDHLALELARNGEAQTVDVTFLPAGFGLWAGMRSASLGADTAIVAVNDLAGRVVTTITPSAPRLDWHASRITGGVFGGVHTGSAWKAAISFGQIPADMLVSIDQATQGFPTLAYSASHSTLDMAAYVGPELLTGMGSVYLELVDVPRLGLSFSISGMTYQLWSNGPERLGRWYMDVAGMQFAVSPISFHQRWIDNWILQAGADLEFRGTIEIRHFYLLASNLQSLRVTVTAPSLQVSVDGVLTLAFDTVMHTTGYASLYLKALWGWICILCYYVSFDRAGAVPTYFHTWGYSWNRWEWSYLSYPIGMCSWTSIKIRSHYIEVALRLPSGFSTYANAYTMAYGSRTLFVNPGGLVPFNLVYLYAVATGFDGRFGTFTRDHCT